MTPPLEATKGVLDATGKLVRRGRRTLADGSIYEGTITDGRREGEGVLKYPDGVRYVGEFKANHFHGYGHMTYGPSLENGVEVVGRSYDGYWQGGLMHGEGSYVSGLLVPVARNCNGSCAQLRTCRGSGSSAASAAPEADETTSMARARTGDTYRGGFARGAYHGRGKLVTAAGDHLDGDWRCARLSGAACIMYARGGCYTGDVRRGEPCGRGRMSFPRGQGAYDGEYKDGLQHGRGTRTFSNGSTYEGEWTARCTLLGHLAGGIVFEGEPHGEGAMRYANGDMYVGQWDMGHRGGRGVLTTAAGDRYEGTFLNGTRARSEPALRAASLSPPRRYDARRGSIHDLVRKACTCMPCFQVMDITIERWSAASASSAAAAAAAAAASAAAAAAAAAVAASTTAADAPYGRGCYIWADGGRYEGNFAATAPGIGHDVAFPRPDGRAHGRGARVWASGARYEGGFAGGLADGHGAQTQPDGERYEGPFKAGLRHGAGVCWWGNTSGAPFTELRCTARYVDISSYEGPFKAGLRHGAGVCWWGNTSGAPFTCALRRAHPGRARCRFEGVWERGAWAEGRFTCADGLTRAGTWRDGKLHGHGAARLVPAVGAAATADAGGFYRARRYSGAFADGARNGFGVLVYGGGDSVAAHFVRGHAHGIGVYRLGGGARLRPARMDMGTRAAWLDWDQVEDSELVRRVRESHELRPNVLMSADSNEVRRVAQLLGEGGGDASATATRCAAAEGALIAVESASAIVLSQ
ncbi:hypothetical protein JKP88DRAFT_299697 [Tribonema minus]|uniref:Uncharacterized protein n=1 Tax=Tribonema minus TaxID=303371 RepID=A0A835ZJE6_9STRA|nr:hypothetical protein JKP88DRAFT_299697 [Tribonema minus]